MDTEIKNSQDDRTGLLIGGTITLGVGTLFLLVNLDILPGFHDMWPIFIIIVGLALIVGGFSKKKKTQDLIGS